MTATSYVESVSTPRVSVVTGVTVAVPSISDADTGEVAVDVAEAGFEFDLAVGDAVIAAPLAALPTDASLGGAWVSDANEVTITFTAQDGGVTGANRSFALIAFDLTP